MNTKLKEILPIFDHICMEWARQRSQVILAIKPYTLLGRHRKSCKQAPNQEHVGNGYYCEDCEEAIWPATTRSELKWLREREMIVREVAGHLSGGVDSWMDEGLRFLYDHSGHYIMIREKP